MRSALAYKIQRVMSWTANHMSVLLKIAKNELNT